MRREKKRGGKEEEEEIIITIIIIRTTIKKQKVESKTVEKCGSDDGKWLQIFPLGASLFFNSLWSPLSRAAGLPGTLPRFRPRLRPGTPPPLPPLLRGFQLGLLCIVSSTSSSDAKHERASERAIVNDTLPIPSLPHLQLTPGGTGAFFSPAAKLINLRSVASPR